MRTEADRKIEETLEHVRRAIDTLSDVVIDNCPGWEDYKEEWQQKYTDALNVLLRVRHTLKK